MRFKTCLKVTLIFLVIVCLGARGQTARPIKAATAPETAEGQKAVQYLWNTILTKCGDAWYYGGSKLMLADWFHEKLTDPVDQNGDRSSAPTPLMWEYKGVTFELQLQTISQVEALNGLTWKGVASIKMTAWRARDVLGNWSDWRDPKDVANGFRRHKVFVEKIKGLWVYRSAEFMGSDIDPMHVGDQVSATELAPRNKPSCRAVGVTQP